MIAELVDQAGQPVRRLARVQHMSDDRRTGTVTKIGRDGLVDVSWDDGETTFVSPRALVVVAP